MESIMPIIDRVSSLFTLAFVYLLTIVFERQSKTFHWFTPRETQEPGLGQVGEGDSELHLGRPHGRQGPPKCLGPICYLPGLTLAGR